MDELLVEVILEEYEEIVQKKRERILTRNANTMQNINRQYVRDKVELFIKYMDYPEELSEVFRVISDCYKESWADHIACPHYVGGCSTCANKKFLYSNLLNCINKVPDKPLIVQEVV